MKVYCKDCKYLKEENFESNVGYWCVKVTIDRFPNFELIINCSDYKPKWWVRITGKRGNNMSHGIVECRECGKIIRQCRCMENHRVTTFEICERCKAERKRRE